MVSYLVWFLCLWTCMIHLLFHSLLLGKLCCFVRCLGCLLREGIQPLKTLQMIRFLKAFVCTQPVQYPYIELRFFCEWVLSSTVIYT